MKYTTHNFASVYGAGSYDQSTYSTGTTSATNTSAGAAGSSGVLANTGFDLILGATIGSVIIFSALVIRFWKKPSKKSTSSAE
jgi:hypothetical protein